ncbi:uncharacterized protein [Amphiura filiformis]|uniref:uncharacterized protein n=1 Tax=Amphiura filiformis TaxID=82378 RepID=UPI003B21C5FB
MHHISNKMSEMVRTSQPYVQEENNWVKRSGSYGNYHSALLLVFLLGTLGIALAFAPVLVLPSYHPRAFATNVANFTTVVGGMFALSVATTSLGLIIGRKKIEGKGYVQFPTESHSNHRVTHPALDVNGQYISLSSPSRGHENINIHRFQLVLFGIGGIIYLIIDLVKMSYNQTTVEAIVVITDDVTHLISLAAQMIFFIMYEGALLRNVTALHYAIAMMIADKVWTWISLTLSSVADIAHQPNIGHSNNSTNALETSQSFLEPFFIEFLTTCVGILLYMWSSIGKKPQRRTCFEDETGTDDEVYSPYRNYDSIITESQEHRLLSNDGDTVSDRTMLRSMMNVELQDTSTLFPKSAKRVGVLLSVITSVSYLIAGLILRDGPLEYVGDSLRPFDRMYILLGVKVVVFGPLTILCTISAYKMYKNTNHTPASLSTNDYLLLVTTAGVFLWFLFKLIATIAVTTIEDQNLNITYYNVMSYCAEDLVCIVNTWVLTQFLLGAHSIYILRYPLSKLTKICLTYLAAISVSEWLQLALERDVLIHRYSTLSPVLNAVYGDIGTRVLIYVFYPIMELYRFHSVVMACEILISK